MFREFDTLHALIANSIIIIFWSLLVLLMAVFADTGLFDPKRKKYIPLPWEQNGSWYKKKLKINKWKDILPQFIIKKGFSKKHISNSSKKYVDRFIMETCRAEWYHRTNMYVIALLILINELSILIICSIAVILINLPFICIQRYNRFRLQKFKQRHFNASQVSI